MHRDGQVSAGGSFPPSLQRGIQEIPRTVVSHIKISRARMRRCDFDQTFDLQSQSKTVSIKNQVKKSHNPFLLNNIGDGTLPRTILGGTGTRPEAGRAHERTIQVIFLLQ